MDGRSLDEQERQLRVYALQHRMTLHALHRDSESGMATTIEKRNGLKQAIIMAKSTGYPILCTSLDRLGRDRDLLVREVLQQGVRVITVDSGRELTADEFVAAAEEAQREGKRIAADTRAGLKGSAHRSPGARKGGKVRGAVLKEQALDGAIEALEKMAEIELKAGRKLGHTEIARSCPIGWCNSSLVTAFSGKSGRDYQAATADSMMF
jgi:DNA invertase Pin-like site-specific DNA recombinase